MSEKSEVMKEGIWFQSAVSGLWYQEPKAAGDISTVKVDGKNFIPEPDGRLESCENCGKGIFEGDQYFQWCGEEAVTTCQECGGANKEHELTRA